MEHAGARVTRIRTRMFIYTLSLSSTIPSSHEGGERRVGRLKRLESQRGISRDACLVSDDAESGHEDGGAKGAGSRLPHRPAMCFRASRVSRGGSSIQIEEG